MGAIQKYLISLVLFSTVIILLGISYTGLATIYEPTQSINLTTYNQFSQTYSIVNQSYSAVKAGDISLADSLTVLFNGGLAALKLVMTSITIPAQIVAAAVSDLGIPAELIAIIGAVVMITIMFALISAIFKHEV